MALTYAQLVVAVSDYCENTFNTTDMNTMIKQAEQRIYNTVQIANLRKNVTICICHARMISCLCIRLPFIQTAVALTPIS